MRITWQNMASIDVGDTVWTVRNDEVTNRAFINGHLVTAKGREFFVYGDTAVVATDVHLSMTAVFPSSEEAFDFAKAWRALLARNAIADAARRMEDARAELARIESCVAVVSPAPEPSNFIWSPREVLKKLTPKQVSALRSVQTKWLEHGTYAVASHGGPLSYRLAKRFAIMGLLAKRTETGFTSKNNYEYKKIVYQPTHLCEDVLYQSTKVYSK